MSVILDVLDEQISLSDIENNRTGIVELPEDAVYVEPVEFTQIDDMRDVDEI